ncbi:MAG: hypothetical protein IPM54_12335 [Polyangiaceae bacterium]|nr:hypothetical protein [Polyangiaceae bacterium]
MPPEYGLTCAKPVRFLADAAEFFHGIELRDVTVAEQSVGRGDPRFFAAPAQGKKKEPVRVHVCVRPPQVPKPYIDAQGRLVQVTEWAYILDDKRKKQWTPSKSEYTRGVETG